MEAEFVLKEPDAMIGLLMDLGANWSVLRNGKDFINGRSGALGRYWDELDACMDKVCELTVALTKLRSAGHEMSNEQDVEKWLSELEAAGWRKHATMPNVWVSPWGGWYRGPYKAWQLMKQSVEAERCEHGFLPEWCEVCCGQKETP